MKGGQVCSFLYTCCFDYAILKKKSSVQNHKRSPNSPIIFTFLLSTNFQSCNSLYVVIQRINSLSEFHCIFYNALLRNFHYRGANRVHPPLLVGFVHLDLLNISVKKVIPHDRCWMIGFSLFLKLFLSPREREIFHIKVTLMLVGNFKKNSLKVEESHYMKPSL